MGTTVPAPIQVSPSKSFDGNDGLWSSFMVRVGNPASDYKVLVSTLVPETWVVLSQGCDVNSASDCGDDRGFLFDPTASTTWQDQKDWSFGVELNHGFSNTDYLNYGYDTLGVQTPVGGVNLDDQVIAGFETDALYLGNLGVAASTPPFNNNTKPSFIQSLKNQKKIPSLSYSYTAGAHYNGTVGSLTLGGLDSSRSIPNDMTITFTSSNALNLVVGLQSITFNGPGAESKSLLQDGILLPIDSTIPDLWLPLDACNAFADAFGLDFNQPKLKYVINETQHTANVKNNPSVSFQIGELVTGGQSVNISFPYSAFDLNFTDPKVSNPIPFRYFPIRQAATQAQYALGRTFLQEAVLTVDYERQNFSIGQALPVSTNAQARIVPIVSPEDSTSTNGGTTPSSSASPANPSSTAVSVVSNSSAPVGVIAGVVVAVVAVIAAIIVFFLMRRRRRRRITNAPANPDTPGSPPMAPHPNKPELSAEKSPPADSYFALPTRQPPRTKSASSPQVSTREVNHHELPSPPMPSQAFSASQQNQSQQEPPEYSATGTTPTINQPIELPGGLAGHELHSRSTSISSTSFNVATRGSPVYSPVSAPTHPSPDLHPYSATGSNGPWGTGGTHLEPGSPLSAMSVPVHSVGAARIVSHHRHPSRGQELRREGSGRSAESEGTLIGGLSGRTSPEGVVPNSAFQSPNLGFVARPLAEVERVDLNKELEDAARR